jgi:hypothetical protein
VLTSRCTDAVKPAADEPFPEVYTEIGETYEFSFRQHNSSGIDRAWLDGFDLFYEFEQLRFGCSGISQQ